MNAPTRCLFILLSLSLLSCGGGKSDNAVKTGAVAFGIKWVIPGQQKPVDALAGALYAVNCATVGVSTISVEVRDAYGTSIATGGPWGCSAGAGLINSVPVGSNYTFAVNGMNGGGANVYQGLQTAVYITAGNTNDIGTIAVAPASMCVSPQVFVNGACGNAPPGIPIPPPPPPAACVAPDVMVNGVCTTPPPPTGTGTGTMTCPPDTTGTYPNCVAMTCPAGQTGTYPNCVAVTYSLSGAVTLNGGAGSGVTMTLSGASSAITTTDSNGSYTFGNLPNGSYTITPTMTGYTFSPASSFQQMNGYNITAVNFTATVIACPANTTGTYPNCVAMTCSAGQTGTYPNCVAATYSLSGTVTSSGVALSGVGLTLNGVNWGTVTNTDAGGNYSFSNLVNGSYTIRPDLPGYTFSPASSFQQMNGYNITAVNFTATAMACPAGQTGTYPNCTTPTYTNNGNGTVTANATGLVWQQQDDATRRDWATAGTYCAGLSLGGVSNGWRLPTKDELVGIVDTSYTPTINPIFTGTKSSFYWSSTTYAGNTSVAWFVDFYDGNVYNSNKPFTYYARCVRLGP